MQPSLPAKLDILEEEAWRSREHKRRSAGTSLWHSTDNASQVITTVETGCGVAQCDDMMVCSGGWATRGGPNPGSHPCCAANPCTGCRPVPTTPGMMHKKGSGSRSGSDMLKRFRVQTASSTSSSLVYLNHTRYELSQDLLEKQVEMLERKYGGAKARRAALIIQRAFRRYKLLNKFAAITAMAKAEKRLSRRFQVTVDMGSGNGNPGSPIDWSPSHHNYQISPCLQGLTSTPQQHPAYSQSQSQYHQQHSSQHLPCEQCGMGFDPEVVIRNNFAALYRELRENCDERPPRPVRSMSMRERRGTTSSVVSPSNPACCRSGQVDVVQPPQPVQHPPLPRSQSAGVTHQPTLQASEAELADREMPSYSQFEEYCMYYTATALAPCPHHSQQVYTESTCASANHYYTTKEMLSDDDNVQSNGNLSRESAVRRSIATSPPSACHNMQWPRKEGTPPHSNRSSSMSAASGALSTSGEWGPQGNKKVPPEVPKRTTSILSRSRSTASPGSAAATPGHCRGNSLLNGSVTISSVDTASLSSSDSSLSLSIDRSEAIDVHRDSPMWKRKGQIMSPDENQQSLKDENGKESSVNSSLPSQLPLRLMTDSQPPIYKVSETVRKRQYRVGLNLFNKKPERGITHLIRRGFLENSPQGVARFLITRKGLSKQMIGEYLGTLQNPFNMAVLECFAQELDISGMHIDVALRKFQTYFRMPGEAQKIERLMEIFGQRYCQCNSELVSSFRSADTVFVLAFAIIMLNTDLHTPNLKPERRMKLEDFVKNLRGIDDSADIDREVLVGIYERVKNSEFKPGSDHVTQVMKVQSTIGGKKPNLALPHRRLVCYCRLYEIPDIYKKERPGVHQREVFLFNDLLVITKIFSKKKSSVTYSFRQSFTLCGMNVAPFETQYYLYGIRLSQRIDGKVLVMFNARNEHDRCKFAEDLRESICEMDEMESIRIEAELERQKSGRRRAVAENRDSGVADVEVALSPTATTTAATCPALGVASHTPIQASPQVPPAEATLTLDNVCDRVHERERPPNDGLKRSALSNSLLDIHDQFAGEKPQRRGSVGSLDSGMSISFQSTSASTVSRDSSPQNIQPSPAGASGAASTSKHTPSSKALSHQQSFLGGLFSKRDRKASRSDDVNPYSRSTEV